MKTTSIFLLILSFMMNLAFAEPKKPMTDADKEMMHKMHLMAMPSEEHKILAQLAGKWTYTSKSWEKTDAKPQESKGTSTMKMILGGRFLQQDVTGRAMGMDYTGMGLIGYDTVQKRYDTTWMDTMSTGMMKGSGQYDPATATLSDKGQYTCPMKESKVADYRSDMKIIDKDNMTFTLFGEDMKDHKEFKMMEMTYKRK